MKILKVIKNKMRSLVNCFFRTLVLIILLKPVIHSALPLNVHFFPVLPIEMRQNHKKEVQSEIEKRWEKVLQQKSSFAPYEKKSDQEIIKEFHQLNHFRQHLWYRNPEQSPHICQEDYMAAQDLLEKG